MIELQPSAGVTVRVQDADGKPIARAAVLVQPRFVPFIHMVHWSEKIDGPWIAPAGRQGQPLVQQFFALTDAAGVGRFTRLPVPQRDLQQQSGGPYEVVGLAEGHALARLEKLSPVAGTTKEVTLVLQRSQTRTIRGIVRSLGGAPIVGAEVKARGARTTTDSHGGYRLANLDPSPSARVTAQATAYAPQSREVDTSAVTELEGIDFELEECTPIGGRVVEESGAPVPGVGVSLRREAAHGQPPRAGGQVVTGPDGTFMLPEATSGTWRLELGASQEWERPLPLLVQGGDRNVEIVLCRRAPRGPSKLIAEVVDRGTGEPLEPKQARLTKVEPLFKSMWYPPQCVLSVGQVSAEGLSAGTWTLGVETSTGTNTVHRFDVKEHQDVVRLRLEVGPPGVILGRVRFDDLPPERRPAKVEMAVLPNMDAIWVSAPGIKVPGPTPGYVAVERDGAHTFRLEKVPIGKRIWIQPWTPGLFAHAEVVVPSTGQAEVELRLQVAGQLRFVSDQPLRAGSGEVSVQGPDGQWIPTVWLSSPYDGQLPKKVSVAPGRQRWRLLFREAPRVGVPRRIHEQTGEVEVRADQTVDVKLELR